MKTWLKSLLALAVMCSISTLWAATPVVDWSNFGTEAGEGVIVPGSATTDVFSLDALPTGVTVENGDIVIGSTATRGVTITLSQNQTPFTLEMVYSLEQNASETGALATFTDSGNWHLGVLRTSATEISQRYWSNTALSGAYGAKNVHPPASGNKQVVLLAYNGGSGTFTYLNGLIACLGSDLHFGFHAATLLRIGELGEGKQVYKGLRIQRIRIYKGTIPTDAEKLSSAETLMGQVTRTLSSSTPEDWKQSGAWTGTTADAPGEDNYWATITASAAEGATLTMNAVASIAKLEIEGTGSLAFAVGTSEDNATPGSLTAGETVIKTNVDASAGVASLGDVTIANNVMVTGTGNFVKHVVSQGTNAAIKWTGDETQTLTALPFDGAFTQSGKFYFDQQIELESVTENDKLAFGEGGNGNSSITQVAYFTKKLTAYQLRGTDGRSDITTVHHSSGTLDLTSTGTGTNSAVLLGHWPNGRTTYNLSGTGVLKAEGGAMRIGHDSPVDVNVTGGTLRVRSIEGKATTASTLAISESGRVEIGTGGIPVIANLTVTLADTAHLHGYKPSTETAETVTQTVAQTIALSGTPTLSAETGTTLSITGALTSTEDTTVLKIGDTNATGTVKLGNLDGFTGSVSVDTGTLDVGTLRPTLSGLGADAQLLVTASEEALSIHFPLDATVASVPAGFTAKVSGWGDEAVTPTIDGTQLVLRKPGALATWTATAAGDWTSGWNQETPPSSGVICLDYSGVEGNVEVEIPTGSTFDAVELLGGASNTLTITLAGNASLGALTLSGNVIMKNLGFEDVAVNIGRTLTLDIGASVTNAYSGQISGAGSVVIPANTTLTLSGDGNYSGGTAIDAGAVVTLGHVNALGTGPVSGSGQVLITSAACLPSATATGNAPNVQLGASFAATTWTGTVTIRGVDKRAYVCLAPLGNAASTLELDGLRCYLQTATQVVFKTLKLSKTLAASNGLTGLYIDDGNGGTVTHIKATLTGDGPITMAKTSGPRFGLQIIGTPVNYTGDIEIRDDFRFALVKDDAAKVAFGNKNATTYNGKLTLALPIAVDAEWSADNGFCVTPNGEVSGTMSGKASFEANATVDAALAPLTITGEVTCAGTTKVKTAENPLGAVVNASGLDASKFAFATEQTGKMLVATATQLAVVEEPTVPSGTEPATAEAVAAVAADRGVYNLSTVTAQDGVALEGAELFSGVVSVTRDPGEGVVTGTAEVGYDFGITKLIYQPASGTLLLAAKVQSRYDGLTAEYSADTLVKVYKNQSSTPLQNADGSADLAPLATFPEGITAEAGVVWFEVPYDPADGSCDFSVKATK